MLHLAVRLQITSSSTISSSAGLSPAVCETGHENPSLGPARRLSGG